MVKLLLGLNRFKFIIDDFSDYPHVVEGKDLKSEVRSILNLCADMAEDNLLSDDKEENPSQWRVILNNVLDCKPKVFDPEWWVRVYQIDEEVVDAWNSYCKEKSSPKDIIDLDHNNTIEEALKESRKHKSLLDFLDSEYGVYESYYIPEEVLKYKRVNKHL